MGLCNGGDLLTLLSQDERLPEPAVRSLGLGLARGLQAVHSKGLVARSLQPATVFADDGKLLLADLSAALVLQPHADPQDRRLAASFADTATAAALVQDAALRPYLPPEVSRGDAAAAETAFTCAGDMWSLGCIL